MSKIAWVFVLLILAPLSGCRRMEESGANTFADRTVRAVATTGMVADAVARVGKDRVDLTALMGPGVDPHLYQATAGDAGKIAGADVIFYNGLHLEGKMTDIFEKMKAQGKRTTAVSDGISETMLLSPPEFEGAHDPHVWFDVALWMKAVKQVRNTLVEMDPDHEETYQRNTEEFLAELEACHAYVKEQTEKVSKEQRVLITAHDAFNYFGRAYGFEVKGLQGISTSTEAGIGDVQELSRFIVNRKIPAMFVESSVPRRSIEAVQAAVRDKGFEVKIGGELFSDALGSTGTPEGTYIGMVRHNIDTITRALAGR